MTFKRIIAAGLAANTAWLQAGSGLAVPAGLTVPVHRVSDGGWLNLSLIKSAQAEVIRPMLPRYIGVLGGHHDARRNDYELDRYLAGDMWCGQPQPGDCIELVGEYNTTRTFSLNGNSAQPFIFKSLTKGSAKVTGSWTSSGSWQFFWGFSFTKAAAQGTLVPGNRGRFTIGGDDNVLRRCEFTQWDYRQALSIAKGNRGIVDYCEWHDPMPWTTGLGSETDGVPLYPANANDHTPLRMGVRTQYSKVNGDLDPTTWHYGLRFRRTYLHDFPDKPIPGNYGSGQDDALEIGGDPQDMAGSTLTSTTTGSGNDLRTLSLTSYLVTNMLFEYILIENHHEGQAPGADAAIFDNKAGNITIKKVCFKNCFGRLSVRSNPKAVWEDIVMRNTIAPQMFGYGHTVTRMKIIDGANFTNSNFILSSGNCYSCFNGNVGNRAPQQASQAIACTQIQGVIQCGHSPSSGSPPVLTLPIKAYDHVFTRCGTVTVANSTLRGNCTQDGLPANVDPYECKQADVGLNAAFVAGEYP